MKPFKQSKKTFSVILLLLVASGTSQASELSFEEVWSKIKSKSAAQEASKLTTDATLESKARAGRHWLPKVYLDSKAYSTNDPAAVFFGLLEQKALVQSDFAPSTLNNPEAKTLARTALGIDMPLYEGGMKESQVKMLEQQSKAQELQSSQIEVEQFAMVGKSYANLIVAQKQLSKLIEIKSEVSRLIKNYQLGSKSNPVGYSGLLGMQSVENKLQALTFQTQGIQTSQQKMLQSLGLGEANLQVKEKEPRSFVEKYLNKEQSASSFKVQSAKAATLATSEMLNMQKAKLRPRVGAFAETYSFNGSRDTSNGYMAGLYLQWSLYNPADYDQDKELHLQKLAKQKYSEAEEQQENAEKAALSDAKVAIEKNLDLFIQTEKIMQEQSQVAAGLFRNGSINALQLVEIYNRRADLIQQQTEAELAFIKVSTELVTKTQFGILNFANNDQLKLLGSPSETIEAQNERH